MVTSSDRLQNEVDVRPSVAGISPADLLDLPELLRTVVGQLIRSNGMTLEQIAKQTGQPVPEAQGTVTHLIEKGLVRSTVCNNEIVYKAQFVEKTEKTSVVWSLLNQFPDDEK